MSARDCETRDESQAAQFERDHNDPLDVIGYEPGPGDGWDNPRRVIDPVGVLGDAIREAMRRREDGAA